MTQCGRGATICGVLAAAGMVTIAFVRRNAKVVTVHGESMEPTFHDGDRVIAWRRKPPQRDDVVVFAVEPGDRGYVNELFAPAARVKRVVAIGHDRAPEWIPRDLLDTYGPYVPAGAVVVAGDAARSEGSATLGYIGRRRIIGVVVRRLGGSRNDRSVRMSDERGASISTPTLGRFRAGTE